MISTFLKSKTKKMFNSQEEYNTLFAYYLSNIYLGLKLITNDFSNEKNFLNFMILIFGFYLLKLFLYVDEKEELKIWIFLVGFIMMNDIIYYSSNETCRI